MTVTSIASEQVDPAALAAMNARDRAIDPQLPDRGFAPGARLLTVESRGGGGDGIVHALGLSQLELLTETEPGAPWGALRRASLQLRWDGDTDAVEQLLNGWIDEVRPRLVDANGRNDDWESAISLTVPSRDSGLVRPLLALGFAPVGVEAVRLGARGADAADAKRRLAEAGLGLRLAGIEDVKMLAELDSELHAHETAHGGVTTRPNVTETLQHGIEARLRRDPEWSWVVERDGVPVGYLSIESAPERYQEQIAAGSTVAYIQAMYLRPEVRGSGLGEAIVDFGHGRLEAVGYERILLNYAALNPRSGPFWCRMGYRPLWTTWQRRPVH